METERESIRGCLLLLLIFILIPTAVWIMGCRAKYLPKISEKGKIFAAAPKCFWSDHYEVPEGVQRIGVFAFRDRTTLKSVKLPAETTTICDSAFDGCRVLESVTFPDALKFVGNSAFRDCTSLRSADLSASVTVICNGAFSGCIALGSVTFSEDLNTVGAWAFNDCTSLRSIDLPASVTWVGEYVFNGCTALQMLTIRNPDAEVEFFNSRLDHRVVQNCTIRAPKRSKVWKAAEKAGFKCVPLED